MHCMPSFSKAALCLGRSMTCNALPSSTHARSTGSTRALFISAASDASISCLSTYTSKCNVTLVPVEIILTAKLLAYSLFSKLNAMLEHDVNDTCVPKS